MATTAAPTAREVVWLAFLLVFLLIVTPRREYSEGLTKGPSTHSWSSHHQTATTDAQKSLAVDAKPPATRLSWQKKQVPPTQILAHTPGWTVFDKLYILRGVVYIVSDEPAKVPNVTWIYSKGLWIENGEEKVAARLPTEEDIRVISTEEAATLFGTGAHILDGVTYFTNDPYQFVTHYYHWSAELWFGFWRTYAALDPFITKDGNTTLPPVRRFMFNHLDAYHWRDYASMNEFVIRSALPSAVMEFRDDWRDRAEMDRPFVFERVIVADRSAAMRSWNYARFQRTAASPAILPGSAYWWQPLRDHAVQLAGLDPSEEATKQPVITYISRQEWGRRMLIKEDHEKLVKELYKLRDEHGIEVNIVSAEKMSRSEQINLAGRTTILMGVHGNGLTSLLWMKPSPRSTVMEFFYPGGFAFDYEYTTRAAGMTHYGFWGSTYFTSPGVPEPKYVEGFQGNSIPLDGALVARLCLERLTLAEEVDD